MESKISRSKTLRSQVYEVLLEKIVNGHIMPGDRLIEEKIAEETGVSRSPIREAIRRLEKEGLVTVNPNGGVRVFNPTPEDFRLLYECRLSLEPTAVYFAAHRIPPSELSKLEQLMSETVNPESLREWNHKFHQILLHASGNPYLISMMDQLQALLLFYRNVIFQVPIRFAPGMEEHQAIFEAVRSGDGLSAKHQMEQHIHNDFEICMNVFQELK